MKKENQAKCIGQGRVGDELQGFLGLLETYVASGELSDVLISFTTKDGIHASLKVGTKEEW